MLLWNDCRPTIHYIFIRSHEFYCHHKTFMWLP